MKNGSEIDICLASLVRDEENAKLFRIGLPRIG